MLLIGTAVRISTRVSTCGLTLEALFSGGAYIATLRRRKRSAFGFKILVEFGQRFLGQIWRCPKLI